jgi:hypothetical protein
MRSRIRILREKSDPDGPLNNADLQPLNVRGYFCHRIVDTGNLTSTVKLLYVSIVSSKLLWFSPVLSVFVQFQICVNPLLMKLRNYKIISDIFSFITASCQHLFPD